MALVLLMVVLAFGLLYVAVVAEERQMQEATKPRKRYKVLAIAASLSRRPPLPRIFWPFVSILINLASLISMP